MDFKRKYESLTTVEPGLTFNLPLAFKTKTACKLTTGKILSPSPWKWESISFLIIGRKPIYWKLKQKQKAYSFYIVTLKSLDNIYLKYITNRSSSNGECKRCKFKSRTKGASDLIPYRKIATNLNILYMVVNLGCPSEFTNQDTVLRGQ